MKNNRQTVVRVIIILLALTGAMLYLFLGSVSASLGKDSITVSGTLSEDATVQYSDIQTFELHNRMDLGTCSFGLSTRRVCTGRYSSPVYGSYRLFIYRNVNKLIMLKTADTVVIFNRASEEETAKCFEEISARIQKLVAEEPPAKSTQQNG